MFEMKLNINNIEHQLSFTENNSFFLYNILESETLELSLSDLLESGVLDKAYFYSEEELKIRNNQLADILKSASSDIEVTHLYGSIIQDEITESDFIELDYDNYQRSIEAYLSKMNHDYGYSHHFIKPLQEFYNISIEKLSSEKAENRKFYLLNEDNIHKSKLNEATFYEYFITVISTLENSNRIIVMNFGKD